MARLYAAARSGCGSLRPPIPPRGWRSRAFERWRLARRTPNERSGDGSPSRRTQVSLFPQRHAHVATTVFRSISGMTPPARSARRTLSELVAEFGGEVAAVERAEGRQG